MPLRGEFAQGQHAGAQPEADPLLDDLVIQRDSGVLTKFALSLAKKLFHERRQATAIGGDDERLVRDFVEFDGSGAAAIRRIIARQVLQGIFIKRAPLVTAPKETSRYHREVQRMAVQALSQIVKETLLQDHRSLMRFLLK